MTHQPTDTETLSATGLSRRGFLKGAATAGAAALTLGITARGVLAAAPAVRDAAFNPFVSIGSDGTVTVIAKHFEMGQGTTTGLTTLVAEELDADWAQMKSAFAPADNSRYANTLLGAQGTGGSTAIANSYLQYRQAGAAARDMLVRAAAARWKVRPEAITIRDGILTAGKKRGTFADFVKDAAALTPPQTPALKTPDQFRLIGVDHAAARKGHTGPGRKDGTGKTDGSARFAMDVHLPGMVYAVLVRPPQFGATLTGFDDSAAKALSGFVAAHALPNKAGVAVFARSTWQAFKARDAITARWDLSKAEGRSSADITEALRQAAARAELPVQNGPRRADITAAVSGAARKIEAEFSVPFLAHAPMEPLNCVIEPTATGVRVHDGCQFPAITQPTVAAILGLKPEQVEITTLFAGGSFGRRATPTSDYHAEAAMAFALLGGKTPVKLVWSREDDIKGGYYRSAALHSASIGLTADGSIAGWDHRIATKSILKGSPFEAVMVHNGIDETSVEGVKGSLYALPDMAIALTDFITPVPVLWWRSVGHTHTAFVMESLIDMVAAATGKDPVETRLALLTPAAPTPQQARMAAVVRAARDLAGWGQPVAAGKARGFASHLSFNTYVAMVVDITVDGTKVHVDHVHAAVDCGVAVNPDVIRAQIEGGVGYALSAALRGEITLDKGQVAQSNFPDYEPLRLSEMPEISVRIIASAEAPSGIGEPGVPPVAPALANALFAATGKRVTTLPFSAAGFSFV